MFASKSTVLTIGKTRRSNGQRSPAAAHDRIGGRLVQRVLDRNTDSAAGRKSSRSLPSIQLLRHGLSYKRTSFMTRYSPGQKLVVLCVHVPCMSKDREIDGLRVKLFSRGSTTNPA